MYSFSFCGLISKRNTGRHEVVNLTPCKMLRCSKISEFTDVIYPCEVDIKDTTESSISASYLDCYLNIDNAKLITRLYDKRDDFNFPIVHFHFMNSNIPSARAYGVYVSQLVRYARACYNYEYFVYSGNKN